MNRRAVILVLLIVVALSTSLSAQTTAFNYQGRLTDGGNPANGGFQMQFKLFDSLSGAGQIGSTINDVPVTVAQGTFAVKLDFGSNALSGANRWLEIAVRHNSGESYTTLTPREQIASSPYAVRTLSAATADTATNATTAATATNALNLGGTAANQFVQTGDSRLSDARNPLPNSPSYIQNTSSPQASSSFNISANGDIGGTLTVGGSGVFTNTVQTSIGNIIVGTGKIGIGTSSPGSKLQIEGSGSSLPTFMLGNTTASRFFQQSVHDSGLWFLSGNSFAVLVSDISGATPKLGIGVSTPRTGLTLGWSVPWSADAWGAQMNLSNASALGWNANTAGQRFGIGQTNNGLSFFRTISDFGNTANAAVYDLKISNAGFVGIGMASFSNDPARLLHVNGRARIGSIPAEASTAQVCFNGVGDLVQCGASSLKWKTNVHPFSAGLDIITRLRPINYNWKETGLADIGLGAEDVAKIAPQLTFTNAKGEVEGVKYERLNLLLINAVQEQQAQIELQQKHINNLRRLLCRRSSRARECRER